MIGPGPTFAMLRLILLALLPQIGGIVMMSGGSFPRDVDRRRSTDAASAEDHPRRNAGVGLVHHARAARPRAPTYRRATLKALSQMVSRTG
jgi:hypothetical protein